MQPTTPAMLELRPGGESSPVVPEGLPELPGGWVERGWVIGGHEFRLVLPASPDALLDDPAVIAAHERDEYMPYWAYLWPASLNMARAVMATKWTRGAAALELGAGVGIVGLAGLQAGLQVTFSDYDAMSVELCLWNARRLGFASARGQVLDWRSPTAQRFPIIFGCELLYEDRNHELLIQVLDAMLDDDGVAWFGDGGRVRAERFCRMLPEQGYEYVIYDESLQPLPQLRVGQYQLIQVRQATP